MDLAKAFEILSQGKIVSANSSQYSELANMLLNENFYNELNELIRKIGYRLEGENGYFYISKKGNMNATEQQSFITRHRDVILAIAFLRQLYPRIDRGSQLLFVDTMASYSNTRKEDSTIREKLVHISSVRYKDDDKEMIEQLFKMLEDKGIIEKVHVDNSDKYKVLDAINYYLSIVDSIEAGEDDA